RIKRHRFFDGLRRRLGSADHFHQRNHMWRIERVSDDTAFGALALGLNNVHRNARRPRGKGRSWWRGIVDFLEQLYLEVRSLWCVLLDKVCLGERLRHFWF